MKRQKNACPWITSSLWKVNNLRIPSPYPLPAPSHTCFGINLLGEGGSIAGGGGRPPPPASIFPLTSVGQAGKIWNQPLGRGIKGVGIAIMPWDRYKLRDSKTDNQCILYALFRSNSLRSFQLFISLFLISIGHFYFATLGHYHFALTRSLEKNNPPPESTDIISSPDEAVIVLFWGDRYATRGN